MDFRASRWADWFVNGPIVSCVVYSTGTDEAWEVVRPQGCSPLLVFVNSKSGDNQGVKFLRRFKQLLNPAQVFDLMNGGPSLGYNKKKNKNKKTHLINFLHQKSG